MQGADVPPKAGRWLGPPAAAVCAPAHQRAPGVAARCAHAVMLACPRPESADNGEDSGKFSTPEAASR